MNKLTQDGIDLVKDFEGCRLTAYLCPAKVWTIGYGHTGPDIESGLTWTQDQADQALDIDLCDAGHGVNEYLAHPINDNQFSALVSFVFNLGAGSLHGSTLLRKLNAGDFAGAADEFPKWDNVNHVPNAGLLRRRNVERALFLKPVDEEA